MKNRKKLNFKLALLFGLVVTIFISFISCTDRFSVDPVSNWKDISPTESTDHFQHVWGTDENNFYVVGTSGSIMHYNGSNWNRINIQTAAFFYGIWGSDANNIYVVGTGGTVFHFNGSSWSQLPLLGNHSLVDVYGLTPDNVHILAGGGNLYKINGNQYELITTFSRNDRTAMWGIYGYPHPAFKEKEIGYFAIGFDSRLSYYNGIETVNIEMPIFGPRDIWGVSHNNIFISGAIGVIYHFYNNIKKRYELPERFGVNGIWGKSAKDVYVAGQFGYIYHFDGSNWDKLESPTTESLNEITGVGDNHVVAVGYNGVVLIGER